jgi:rhodanese-related sulfurtransferase
MSGVAAVSRERLVQLMDGGEEFVLVDALSQLSYAVSHIPGAIHIPPEWVDDRAPRRIPDLDTVVVVYCESNQCDSSAEVAKRLVELGYRNVGHYVEGKRDWVAAGLPLDGRKTVRLKDQPA